MFVDKDVLMYNVNQIYAFNFKDFKLIDQDSNYDPKGNFFFQKDFFFWTKRIFFFLISGGLRTSHFMPVFAWKKKNFWRSGDQSLGAFVCLKLGLPGTDRCTWEIEKKKGCAV